MNRSRQAVIVGLVSPAVPDVTVNDVGCCLWCAAQYSAASPNCCLCCLFFNHEEKKRKDYATLFSGVVYGGSMSRNIAPSCFSTMTSLVLLAGVRPSASCWGTTKAHTCVWKFHHLLAVGSSVVSQEGHWRTHPCLQHQAVLFAATACCKGNALSCTQNQRHVYHVPTR